MFFSGCAAKHSNSSSASNIQIPEWVTNPSKNGVIGKMFSKLCFSGFADGSNEFILVPVSMIQRQGDEKLNLYL